jgi:hypothetical protein
MTAQRAPTSQARPDRGEHPAEPGGGPATTRIPARWSAGSAAAVGVYATRHNGRRPMRFEPAPITVDVTGDADGLATVIRSPLVMGTAPAWLSTSARNADAAAGDVHPR